MVYGRSLKENRVVVTVAIATLLLIVPASIAFRDDISAFADGNGYGQQNNTHSSGNSTDDHNNDQNSTSDHENSSNNQTRSDDRSEANQTGSNNNGGHGDQGNGKGPGDDVSGHGHDLDERMKDYVSESSETRHHEHLWMNESTTGPFTSNLNYTLEATGNATETSDGSNVQNASLKLNLSIWKSTHGVVSMDIINGTIKVGSNTIQIYSGHAYYIIHKPRLFVYGFIVDNGTSGNSTSEHSVRMVKLVISGNGTLPATSSDPALLVTVLSPESKIVSEWFLNMSGEVQRS